ncbi:MAG: GNAT family N-acetyltransferase [Candidatus Aenigmatarchaeota archaeon]
MKTTVHGVSGPPWGGGFTQAMARIHEECFPYDATNLADRARILEAWNNPPVMQYWAAKTDRGFPIGYIRWVERGGIRPKAVMELEQIGVLPAYRGKGVATDLIDCSMKKLDQHLKSDERELKLVFLTTAKDGSAQKLYAKTLGAKIRTTIPAFYEDTSSNIDEVVMVALPEDIQKARTSRNVSRLG